MRDRAKSLKRIVEVQRQLHNLEELKLVRLQQEVTRCQSERNELASALSTQEGLEGLFADLTARRMKALHQQEARLMPQVSAQAKVVLEHGGRMRNSERLAEELAVEVRREDERLMLEELLEVDFARQFASYKQGG
jgi:hypothetical protein